MFDLVDILQQQIARIKHETRLYGILLVLQNAQLTGQLPQSSNRVR